MDGGTQFKATLLEHEYASVVDTGTWRFCAFGERKREGGSREGERERENSRRKSDDRESLFQQHN